MSSDIKTEKKKKPPFFKTMLRIIPISYKTTPWHNMINNLLGVFHGLSWAVTVIITQFLFDAIVNAAAGRADFYDCLIPLLMLAGITFLNQILNGVHNFHAGIIFNKSPGKINLILHKKLKRIDPAKFEDTDFLDDLNKAREGISVLPYQSMTVSIFILFYGTYFVSIGSYLFNLKPILLITLMVAFIPAMIAQYIRAKVFSKLEEESAPLRREFEYYQKTINDREYFKETRILGAYKFFKKLFSDTIKLHTLKSWKAERKSALFQLLLSSTTFAGMAIAAYLLFSATMSGEISIGAFAAVFASLSSIFYIMQEIFDMHLSNMNKDIGKLSNFIKMLDLPERKGIEDTLDISKGIVAENISFTYPGREEPAVKNLSLEIKDGETIAVVGENGAGKSTLMRLLTGIYQPDEGKVTIGGLDTKNTNPASIYRGISGVFQKYQKYKMTFSENITISDTEANDFKRNKSKETNEKISKPELDLLNRVITEAGAEIEEAGPDTMLSPEYDGIDLSGGQWQRIAIARGLYRKNDFIILDEPTAAIDPIEETRVYTQFQKLAEGKSAIIVTHRLGSAKLAHRIIVMEGGEIVDSGTHDELAHRDGKYAKMWEAQAMWYDRE